MLNEMAKVVHGISTEHGWWDGKDPTDADVLLVKIALMHSELSEAVEEVRDGVDLTQMFGVQVDSLHTPRRPIDVFGLRADEKPVGFGIELADAIIRILDTCAAVGIDIDEAVSAKIAYNRTRPFKHGGKLA